MCFWDRIVSLHMQLECLLCCRAPLSVPRLDLFTQSKLVCMCACLGNGARAAGAEALVEAERRRASEQAAAAASLDELRAEFKNLQDSLHVRICTRMRLHELWVSVFVCYICIILLVSESSLTMIFVLYVRRAMYCE